MHSPGAPALSLAASRDEISRCDATAPSGVETQTSRCMRSAQYMLVCATMCLSGIAAEAQRAVPESRVVTPALTGVYGVGRRQVVWTDSTRNEFRDSTPGRFRTLVVWIWYPSSKSSANGGEALPAAWSKAL